MDIFQNLSQNILFWAAVFAIIIIGVLLATKRMKKALIFTSKGVVGMGAMWGINLLIYTLNIGISTPGVNFFTMGIATFLGAPGRVMMYGINFVA